MGDTSLPTRMVLGALGGVRPPRGEKAIFMQGGRGGARREVCAGVRRAVARTSPVAVECAARGAGAAQGQATCDAAYTTMRAPGTNQCEHARVAHVRLRRRQAWERRPAAILSM